MTLSKYGIISSINTVVRHCVECPFLFDPINNGRREMMWGNGTEVLFVGQSPALSNKEKRKGSQFDKFFEKIVRKSNIDFDKVSFTNVSKATIPASQSLSEEQKIHCFDHVGFEVAHLKPELVITLGTLAREWSGLTSFGEFTIGRFPYEEEDGSITTTIVPIFAMEHPASIRYGAVREKDIINRLNEAHDIKQRLRNQQVA